MVDVYFDGHDWIHLSPEFCLILPYQVSDFESLCYQHIPLFTRNYFPQKGDIVLDIGAWNGAELPVWSRAVGPTGHVYAVEADPAFYKKMLKVVELLGLDNVTCINAAISDTDGIANLGIYPGNGLNSSIFSTNAPESVQVPAITLDTLLETYTIKTVDYLKMNIEGAENLAVKGIRNPRAVKNWCISTHDFCQIPSKNNIVNFFNKNEIFVDLHEDVEHEPWKGGYVYVNTEFVSP